MDGLTVKEVKFTGAAPTVRSAVLVTAGAPAKVGVAESVYVVVTAGLTLAVPESPNVVGRLASVGLAVMVTLLKRPATLVASQLRVAPAPRAMELGLTLKLMGVPRVAMWMVWVSLPTALVAVMV